MKNVDKVLQLKTRKNYILKYFQGTILNLEQSTMNVLRAFINTMIRVVSLSQRSQDHGSLARALFPDNARCQTMIRSA